MVGSFLINRYQGFGNSAYSGGSGAYQGGSRQETGNGGMEYGLCLYVTDAPFLVFVIYIFSAHGPHPFHLPEDVWTSLSSWGSYLTDVSAIAAQKATAALAETTKYVLLCFLRYNECLMTSALVHVPTRQLL